jgi:hypothetical protein
LKLVVQIKQVGLLLVPFLQLKNFTSLSHVLHVHLAKQQQQMQELVKQEIKQALV